MPSQTTLSALLAAQSSETTSMLQRMKQEEKTGKLICGLDRDIQTDRQTLSPNGRVVKGVGLKLQWASCPAWVRTPPLTFFSKKSTRGFSFFYIRTWGYAKWWHTGRGMSVAHCGHALRHGSARGNWGTATWYFRHQPAANDNEIASITWFLVHQGTTV